MDREFQIPITTASSSRIPLARISSKELLSMATVLLRTSSRGTTDTSPTLATRTRWLRGPKCPTEETMSMMKRMMAMIVAVRRSLADPRTTTMDVISSVSTAIRPIYLTLLCTPTASRSTPVGLTESHVPHPLVAEEEVVQEKL
jgi:hypothetical protein